MLDGILDSLLKLLFDFLQSTNVLPLDGGHLDDGLAERRGVGRAERKAEVLHRDTERVEHFRIDGILVEVDQVHLLADLLHSGFRAERCNIGTDISMGVPGNLGNLTFRDGSPSR